MLTQTTTVAWPTLTGVLIGLIKPAMLVLDLTGATILTVQWTISHSVAAATIRVDILTQSTRRARTTLAIVFIFNLQSTVLILDVTNTAIPALQWTIVLALITRVAGMAVTMLVVGAVPVGLAIKVVVAIEFGCRECGTGDEENEKLHFQMTTLAKGRWN